MILSDGKIRPGRVVSVEDEAGIIKACVPGLFSDQDDPSLLPPVYPFFTGNANSFSKINVDEDVWVIFFENNPYELFWFRKDVLSENLSDILKKEYSTIEVICAKETDTGYIQLYFSDGDGWVIRKDDSVVQIKKNGDIVLDTGSAHRSISITGNGISLGTVGGSAEPAVLGDKLEKCLLSLYNLLSSIYQAAGTLPFTSLISKAMLRPMQKFRVDITKIKSSHVTLD